MTYFLNNKPASREEIREALIRGGFTPAPEYQQGDVTHLNLRHIDRVTLVDALHAFFGCLPLHYIDAARLDAGARLLTALGRPTTVEDLIGCSGKPPT